MKSDDSRTLAGAEAASLISFPNRQTPADIDYSRPSTVTPDAPVARTLDEPETVEAFDAQVMSNQDAVAVSEPTRAPIEDTGIGFNPVLARSASGGKRRKSLFGKTNHTPVAPIMAPVVDEAPSVEPVITRSATVEPVLGETAVADDVNYMGNPILSRTSGSARGKRGSPILMIGGGLLAVALIAGAVVLVMQPGPNAGPQIEGSAPAAVTAPTMPVAPEPTATEAAATPDTSGPTTRVSATAPVTPEAAPAARAPAARTPAARPAPVRTASRAAPPRAAQAETPAPTPAPTVSAAPAATSTLPPVVSAPAASTTPSTLPPPPVLNSPPPAPVPATPAPATTTPQ